jgi:putative transposase
MPRLARIVAVNIPHHVTQRGNARQFILNSDAERLIYLELLQHYANLYELSLLGYCVMSNHVHLVVVPHHAGALAAALKNAHGRYASYWNAVHKSSGHVWQGRFYSCPLDDVHLWMALRYTELNPVRAKLVNHVANWTWSSAAVHCGVHEPPSWLDVKHWGKRWSSHNWQQFLADGEQQSELDAIRQCTHTGRPLGSEDFLQSLEEVTRRQLAPHKGGRPRKASAYQHSHQNALTFQP